MKKVAAAIALAAATSTAAGDVLYAQPGKPGSVDACVAGVKKPGDKCLLQPGRYTLRDFANGTLRVDGKHGTAAQPVVIAGATGRKEDVVFDGTLPVSCKWEPYTSDVVKAGQKKGSPGQPYKCKLSGVAEVNQVFADDVMQVSARWPNARFDDKTIYMGPEYWAHSGHGGKHNVSTYEGIVADVGACANMSDCCGRCNGHDLAADGIDATGASVVMNMWGNGVGVQRVTKHTPGDNKLYYNASWCRETILRRGKCADGYRNGLGRYYVEGTLALLDAPTEWFFDASAGELYLWAADGKEPSGVAYKAQTYAVQFFDSTFVNFGNVTFFGTTLEAFHDEIPSEKKGDEGASVVGKSGSGGKKLQPMLTNFLFESIDFMHPDASRRPSGDLWDVRSTSVWSNVLDDLWPTNHTFSDVGFKYSDGVALHAKGGGNRYRSMRWEFCSWNAFCYATPGVLDTNDDCGTFAPQGAAPRNGEKVMERLTFKNNGPSKTLRPSGENIPVTYVHFEGQLQLANDGCFVETGGPQSAHMHHNWCFNSGKGALRFDGTDRGGTANGLMAFNVGWNVSNFVVKGDNHTFDHNTAFDPSDMGASFGPHSWPNPGQTQFDDLDRILGGGSLEVECPGETTKTADLQSRFTNNILERVTGWKKHTADSHCPFPGENWKNNMVQESDPEEPEYLTRFAINSELRWPWGRDFRRCPGSTADKMDAGAYATWTAQDTQYWIPGALETYPTMPSPRDAEGAAIVDADLLFLKAYRSVQHVVYFGEAGAMKKVATLSGDDNVVQTGAKKPNTKYEWRVDTVYADGSVRTGNVWTFTTGSHSACPPTPHDLPPAPHVAAQKCVDAAMKIKSIAALATEVKKCYHQIKHEKSLQDVCTKDDLLSFCGCSPIAQCDGDDE
eukprot:TRINITY_DN1284_c0_g1_i2.p2 TRINITY_DN1284_c0_g1~~TRINITY_DN1284_c0_g1_i2.p2  ORF type:complete len:898 (+),score=463.46 TRINITY_DN1284_c0_g1_i2:62-2755(+)